MLAGTNPSRKQPPRRASPPQAKKRPGQQEEKRSPFDLTSSVSAIGITGIVFGLVVLGSIAVLAPKIVPQFQVDRSPYQAVPPEPTPAKQNIAEPKGAAPPLIAGWLMGKPTMSSA